MALIRAGARCLQNITRASYVSTRCKSKEEKLPEYMEHATGIERKELLARAAGDDDPFGMAVMKRGPGTKDNPNIVPSYEDKRIVGCICEEDSTTINWMWVHMEEPKRCGCGYYWKLKKIEVDTGL